MEGLLISGAQVVTPKNEGGLGVLIQDGKIRDIVHEIPSENSVERVHLKDGILLPGFIDVHIHGGNGYDVMDAKPESLRALSEYLPSTGTTGFLATTMTAPHDELMTVFDVVRKTESTLQGAKLLGVHLEGPFINPAKKGAQGTTGIREPNIDELRQYQEILQDRLKLITLAPEMGDAIAFTRYAVRQGIVVSAGHTDCSYEQAKAAVDAGISHATHLFNAMTGLHHRAPGLAGAVLGDDRVAAELIADGIHVHPEMMKLAVAAKGSEKLCLITDCMRAGNLTDGRYVLGGQVVSVIDGIARTDAGNLAGSTLKMIDGVKYMVRTCGLPLYDAVLMGSHVPAVELGLSHRKGSIGIGMDADIVLTDSNLNVRATFVEGKLVYQSL